MEELTACEGTVHSVIFQNTENGYTVLRLLTEEGEVVTVVGCIPCVAPGEHLSAVGTMETHPQHGEQLRAVELERSLPEDEEEIASYLGSGVVKGVGPATARRIVDRFGTETLDILEREPERLSLIKGITERKAMEIAESFRHHMGLRRLMEFLARYQLPPVLAMQLRRQYGDAALEKVRENPYLLSGESCGVEFAVTDQIALSLGMELDSLCRVEAAVSFELGHNERNGHVFLPREKLIAATAELLHGSADTVEQALDGLIERGAVVQEGVGNAQACYLRRLWEAEQSACIRLTGLLAVEADRSTQPERAVREIESLQGITYAPLQRQAVELAAREGVVILTGGPGTGKTTTVNAILQLLENQAERVALCAPTGRAAKRLSELTGRKASTIHRLLEVDYTGGVVSFIHNDKNLLKCDVVILDEMSMVDVKLFQALVTALRYSCRIIMVGDADQLPSVGPGNLLGEIIRSGCVPTVCLNEIFRQAKRSLIVENAHHIICGEPLQKGGKTDDFFFLEADGDAAQKLVCDLVTTRLPRSYGFDPVRDIQVLCPTKLGPTGTQALNVELQNLLNPEQKGKPQLQSAARVFRVGDKVMQVRNNYEIVWQRIGGEQGVGAYNGDIGIVESINTRERSMVVRMDDRRLVYPAENLNELEIAYAITVHKSQGSEFPAVVLPVAQVPPRLCYRNLFYTGVTRARKLCIVAGRRDVVNRMMSNVRQNLRYSGLCELLKENLPPEQMAAE